MKHRHKMHAAKKSGGAMGVDPQGPDPTVMMGNKNVVAAAKSTKSLGKISGIYAKGRLDRGRKMSPKADE